MGVLAQNPLKDVEYYQDVSLPLEYATQVLDKNNTGLISIQQMVKDPLLKNFCCLLLFCILMIPKP